MKADGGSIGRWPESPETRPWRDYAARSALPGKRDEPSPRLPDACLPEASAGSANLLPRRPQFSLPHGRRGRKDPAFSMAHILRGTRHATLPAAGASDDSDTANLALRSRAMTASAAASNAADAAAATEWPLRIAQRAFAALLEYAPAAHADGEAFRAARLRRSARRTWSALSADSQALLLRWLTVQLATRASERGARAIARIDAALAANIAAALARVRDELLPHGRDGAAAA
jgi:hypothetical protein